MQQVYNNYFGEYGGRYVAEVLRGALDDLEKAYIQAMADEGFHEDFLRMQKEFIGRPTPLLYAKNTSEQLGGAKIYIKQEGLAATGAHKINNAMGQALLALRMGKTRIIAETGAGQHGVATAAVCAKLGLPCTVYMGEVDMARQRPNVFSMELFGAKVVPVTTGSRTLKDAVNEALRDWAASFEDTHYLIGSALGPSPFPDMVREFQSVIGRETRDQAAELGIDVEALVACVGGGSNAMGFFAPFIDEEKPRLIGVEAGGRGRGIGEHAARMTGEAATGIVQGYKSKFLLDSDGQVQHTHSISAGLDYPGIGPQLAHLGETRRVEFHSATDAQALAALKLLARNEGVIFALESAHGAAYGLELAASLPPGKNVIINMSGRGDKDIFITAKAIQPGPWADFMEREIGEIRASQGQDRANRMPASGSKEQGADE